MNASICNLIAWLKYYFLRWPVFVEKRTLANCDLWFLSTLSRAFLSNQLLYFFISIIYKFFVHMLSCTYMSFRFTEQKECQILNHHKRSSNRVLLSPTFHSFPKTQNKWTHTCKEWILVHLLTQNSSWTYKQIFVSI